MYVFLVFTGVSFIFRRIHARFATFCFLSRVAFDAALLSAALCTQPGIMLGHWGRMDFPHTSNRNYASPTLPTGIMLSHWGRMDFPHTSNSQYMADNYTQNHQVGHECGVCVRRAEGCTKCRDVWGVAHFPRTFDIHAQCVPLVFVYAHAHALSGIQSSHRAASAALLPLSHTACLSPARLGYPLLITPPHLSLPHSTRSSHKAGLATPQGPTHASTPRRTW